MSFSPRTAATVLLGCAISLSSSSLSRGDTFGGFLEVTTEAGVGYVHHSPRAAPNCLFDLLGNVGAFCEPERQTGGAAAGDADGDGWIDLFVTRLDAPDLLFRNLGNRSFEEISEAAGLSAFDLQSNGALWIDVDLDGDLDLYVTTIGTGPPNDRFYLFVNDGQGHFSESALARGLALPRGDDGAGQSIAAGDYDRDGWPDLYVTEWMLLGSGDPPGRNRLLRNQGASAPGHFEDVTEASGTSIHVPLTGGSWGFAPSFTDLDGDGWPDLLVAADFGRSRLFWNRGDGSFEDGTQGAGVGTEENGMGSTLGDYDGDGDLDWFVTSIFDADGSEANWGESGNRLYRNEGARSFSDATDEAFVRDGDWGWGTAFFDADNDGDLDLTMTNGVDYGSEGGAEAQFRDDPMRFWSNDGAGAMSEQGASVGLDATGSGKGLLVFDYDRDGDLDVFVANNATGGQLFQNQGSSGNDWLRVDVLAAAPASPALGARVELVSQPGAEAQVRHIGSVSHFLGQSEATAHFGLGEGPGPPVHEVRVTWPATGDVEVLHDVARNRTVTLPEPTGLAGCAAASALLALRAGRRR